MREIDMPGKYDATAVEAGRYDKWVQETKNFGEKRAFMLLAQLNQAAWKPMPQSAIQCANRNQNSQFIGVRAYGLTSRMLSTPVR